MSWFDFEPAVSEVKATRARLDALEKRQRELEEALLAYLRSDIASSWMVSARRLEKVLVDHLK